MLMKALAWLTSLRETDNLQAGLPLCNIVLGECINKQSTMHIARCLDLMDIELMGKSEITYYELLKYCVMQKSLSAVHDLWKDYNKQYTPSILILRKFIWSFTRLNDMESAFRVLQYMVKVISGKCFFLGRFGQGLYQMSSLDIPIPPVSKSPNEEFWLHENVSFERMPNGNVVRQEDYLRMLYISGEEFDHFADNSDSTDACFVPKTIDSAISSFDESRFSFELNGRTNLQQLPSMEHLLVMNEELVKNSTAFLKDKTLGCGKLKLKVARCVLKLLRWSFNDVIQCCARFGTWETAKLLFAQMHVLGVKPSPHTYEGLVRAASYRKGHAYGLKLLESLERRNIKTCSNSLGMLSAEHSKDLQLNIAEYLLGKISDCLPKYIYPFNVFLVACDVMDKPERAIPMLARLKHLNIPPNIKTFEILFSLFGNFNAPYESGNLLSHSHVLERIKHIEKDMIKYGVQHSYISMKNLIRALGTEGMIPEMLQRLEVSSNMLLAWDPGQITDLYNIVLHALVEARDSLTAAVYFKKMRFFQFPANAVTYLIMMECCSLITCSRTAFALTSLMLRDGFFPEIVTYTVLVKVLLSCNNLEGALDLLNQASSDGMRLEVQLFNEVLYAAYVKISSERCAKEFKKQLIDVVELILEQMHRGKVKPDSTTCACTFSAYTELGFHRTAVEALRVLSLRMISKDEEYVNQEKRNAFEQLVCSEDPDVESKIISIFKDSKEYFATALLSLRWCSFLMGHPVSWSLEESLWAQRLSSSYSSRKQVI
ncbi:Pentatricopeptide repeat-containing protein [Apostasia shenzhenica]|uniref:Pentatricopeptide repeat-containing protein n=1 Tax=Apostasia shenzhenica TaxID=1088818 RepID=A0A2I0ARW3_9ASPA|nr:Pentatricopeptide repeat-containing protein [Apostasia shenzhenica]